MARTVEVPDGYGRLVTVDLAAVPLALEEDADSLAEDFDVTEALTTFLTTAALDVGTWLINFSALCSIGPLAADKLAIQANVGTATATLTGCTATELGNNAAVAFEAPVSLCFKAVVTVAGTVVFQAVSNVTTCVVKAETATGTLPDATGYTALQTTATE